MEDLNTLLLGVVLTKTGTIVGLKFIAKMIQVNILKAIYFRACKKAALIQMENHRNLLADPKFDKQMRRQIHNFDDDRKRMEINAHLLNHKGKNYEYKRLITVFERGSENKEIIDTEPLIVDQIELNSRLID